MFFLTGSGNGTRRLRGSKPSRFFRPRVAAGRNDKQRGGKMGGGDWWGPCTRAWHTGFPGFSWNQRLGYSLFQDRMEGRPTLTASVESRFQANSDPTMKLISACLTLLLLGASALAQSSSGSIAKPASRALLEGIVTKEPGGEPVKKALIELIAENQAEGGDYTAVSGADGMFHMEGIIPGRYRLFTERTGFLEVDKHHPRSDGRVLTLAAGQELKDVRIRLQAAALVRGRVTDEDGEVMPNAQVAVLRQTFVSGRTHFEQVGAERTNDLGEYRVAGLPSGSYYVCVSPPPDFKSLIEAAGAVATAEAGNRVYKATATSYQVVF